MIEEVMLKNTGIARAVAVPCRVPCWLGVGLDPNDIQYESYKSILALRLASLGCHHGNILPSVDQSPNA